MAMAKLKKRTGQTEEFNQLKLESSIRWAGVTDAVAKEIASKLVPRNDMSTSELRSQVLAELKAKDPATAQRYERTRTCRARLAPDLGKETARLHPDTLRTLGLNAGAPLRLEYAGRAANVRTEASPQVALDGVQLHADTLQSIGASVEAKVALMRA